MKLRQKLAMVLAAAMVVTAVPVTTMAKSTNSTTKFLTVQKDSNIGWDKNDLTTTDSAVELKIIPEDGLKNGEEFYLVLDNAKWTDKDTMAQVFSAAWTEQTGVKVERTNDKEVKVTVVNASKISTTKALVFPIVAVATGGEATISIIPENTTLKGEKFAFAATPEADVKGMVTVSETVPSFYTSGKLATITVKETVAGSFNNLENGKQYVKVTLNHSDFEFVAGSDVETIKVGDDNVKTYKTIVKATGTRGASNVGTDVTYTAYVDAKDEQVMYIALPATSGKSVGIVEIKDIQVKSTTRKPETGDFKVDIEGKSINDQTDVLAGKVAEYGVTLTMKDNKPVEIKEGRSGKITFTLAENIEDSMADGSARTVIFTLENGHFGTHEVVTENNKEKVETELPAFKVKDADDKEITVEVVDTIVEDDRIVGFEVKLPTTNNTKIDKFTFEDVVVHAELGTEGEMTIKAEGRAIGDEVETPAVTIVDVVEIDSEAMTVKVGLKEQEGGKIVISETDKGMFSKGKELVFDIENEEGISFTGTPEVKVVEGDLILGDITLDKANAKLTVEVKRASKEASTIEIAGFGVKVDRTVPQGEYSLTVGGSALTDCGSIEVEKFFIVGTPNTEDITNQVKKVVSVFTIGAKQYTVNDVKFEMDAAPYISAENKTMVPVRYVANAFGISEKDILFSNGTVTILAGHRTIQLTIGSDVALLNGAQYKMATPVVLNQDNRTFVPIAEIAKLLGVHYSWNNELKTVTFNNAN